MSGAWPRLSPSVRNRTHYYQASAIMPLAAGNHPELLGTSDPHDRKPSQHYGNAADSIDAVVGGNAQEDGGRKAYR
jgi:hypothetical protein